MRKQNIIIEISTEWDVILAKKIGREKAKEIGFSDADQERVVIVISELARNIFLYAQKGVISIERKIEGIKVGIVVKAIDYGPGIENIQQATMDGFSTSGGLGLGLSGVKRLMDNFIIHSTLGNGTNVEAIKWLKKRS